MLDRLRGRCQNNHVHQQLIGGRAKAAENYPLDLMVESLRGMRDTKDRQMHLDGDENTVLNVMPLYPEHGFADVCPHLRAHRVNAVNNALSEKHSQANNSVTHVGGRRQELTLGAGVKAAYFDEYTAERLNDEKVEAALIDEMQHLCGRICEITIEAEARKRPNATATGGGGGCPATKVIT